ncbi:Ba200 [Baboon cytomegalovirus]|nr:Ba200 [Baboon cytomegalovirus]
MNSSPDRSLDDYVFVLGSRVLFYLKVFATLVLQVTATVIACIINWILCPAFLEAYCSKVPRLAALWLFVPIVSLFTLHLWGKQRWSRQLTFSIIYVIPNTIALYMMTACRPLDKLLLATIVPLAFFTGGVGLVFLVRIQPSNGAYGLHRWLFPVTVAGSALVLVALTIVPVSDAAWNGCYLALLLILVAGLWIHDLACIVHHDCFEAAFPLTIRIYIENLIMYIIGLMIFDPVFWQMTDMSDISLKFTLTKWWLEPVVPQS